MNKTLIAALLGATLLAGGAAAAIHSQTPPQDGPKRGMMRDPLARADADNNGIVTRAEVLAQIDARFAAVDANKDGKITAEERQAARATMGKRMRGGPDREGRPGGRGMGVDADGDGVVTLDEQRAQALKLFTFVDRNGDGQVDQSERQLARDAMKQMGGGRHGPGHGGDMPPPPAPANGS